MEQYIFSVNGKLTETDMITVASLLIKAGYEVRLGTKETEVDGKAKKVKCIIYHS